MKIPDQKFSDLNTLVYVLSTSFRQAAFSEEVRSLSYASEQAILADEAFTASLNMMSDDLKAYYYCKERAKNLANGLLAEYEYFFVQNETLYGYRDHSNILLLTLDDTRLS